MDKEIEIWCDEQIKALLLTAPDGVLQVKNFVLSKQDFLDLTNIAQNHVRVHQFTRKRLAQHERAKIITDKEQGFYSVNYLASLIKDHKEFEEEGKNLFIEIIHKANVNDKIYDLSHETFVGDE